MISVTHLQMAGGESLGHVARLRWYDSERDATTDGSVEQVIEWLREDPTNELYLRQARGPIAVRVAESDAPHLQAYLDDEPNDALLYLPRF